MGSITRQILNHEGKHPDRLSMHSTTLYRMLEEREYFEFMQYRIPRDKPTFGPTAIYHDILIDKNVVIFERRNDNIRPFLISDTAPVPFKPSDQYVETHRIILI